MFIITQVREHKLMIPEIGDYFKEFNCFSSNQFKSKYYQYRVVRGTERTLFLF